MKISLLTKLAWLFLYSAVLLLCLPIIVNLTQKSSVIDPNSLLNLGSVSISTITTIYSLAETALGILSIFIIQWFCREVLKRQTSKMIVAQESIPIGILAATHSSVTSASAGIVFFTTNAKSFAGAFVLSLLVVRFSVEYYKSILSSTTNVIKFYNPKNLTYLPAQALYYPAITNVTFSETLLPNFQISQINSGGKRPNLYFSKRAPSETSFFGLDLITGTIPLFNWPSMTDSTLNETLISTSTIPAVIMSIKDWSYSIVEGSQNTADGSVTFINPVIPSGSVFFSSSAGIASYMYLSDAETDKLRNCYGKKSSPWESCDVAEELRFKIIQRLPDFTQGDYTNSSTWTTDVFYLKKNENIGGALKKLGLSVLTGTLQMNRSEISIVRDMSTLGYNPINLSQTYLRSFANPRVETLYKQAKIAFYQTFVSNFNSSVQQGNIPGFLWTQVDEFRIQGELLYEFRNYSSSTYVNDMTTRLLAVNRAWLSSMTPTQELVNLHPLLYNNSLPFIVRILYPQDSLVLNSSVLAAFFLMVLWVVLLCIMFMVTLQYKKSKFVDGQYSKYASLMDTVWENSYGLELLSKEIISKGTTAENALVKLHVKTETLESGNIKKTSEILN